MTAIIDALNDWIKQLLIGLITSNLTSLFDDVNTKVGSIAGEVSRSPQAWNAGIFTMIRNLSDTVIMPIAGMIITGVLCYELISSVMEKNNLHDVETFVFFKYLFKSCIAIYLVSNTFTIAMAIFDVASHVITSAGGIIHGSTNIDITTTLTALQAQMATMENGELLQLTLETAVISLCLKIMSILITVILYGRMIEIYITVSVAPIPMATLSNREWGSVGTNYVKSLLALGFQGFFMMICVAIYAVLVNAMTISTNIHTALFSVAAYTVILCFSLMKTGSLSRSIFGAH